MQNNIRNTNLRFNLDKEQQRESLGIFTDNEQTGF